MSKHMTGSIRSLLPGKKGHPQETAETAGELQPASAAQTVRVGTGRRSKRKNDDREPSRYDIADGVSIFEVKPFHLGMFQGDELAAVQFRFC